MWLASIIARYTADFYVTPLHTKQKGGLRVRRKKKCKVYVSEFNYKLYNMTYFVIKKLFFCTICDIMYNNPD